MYVLYIYISFNSYFISLFRLPNSFPGDEKYKRNSGKIMCSPLMQILLLLTFPCTNIPLYQTFPDSFLFSWLLSTSPISFCPLFPKTVPKRVCPCESKVLSNYNSIFLNSHLNLIPMEFSPHTQLFPSISLVHLPLLESQQNYHHLNLSPDKTKIHFHPHLTSCLTVLFLKIASTWLP